MFFFVVAALVGLSPAIAQTPSSLSLEAYARSQSQAAFIGIVANTYAPGSAYPGAIIASPATDTAAAGRTGGQNYYYSWTRDAALTIKTVINQYASGDNSLEPFIKAYIENERVHQHLDTLSGNFTSGGLAEPKVIDRSFDIHAGINCDSTTSILLRSRELGDAHNAMVQPSGRQPSWVS